MVQFGLPSENPSPDVGVENCWPATARWLAAGGETRVDGSPQPIAQAGLRFEAGPRFARMPLTSVPSGEKYSFPATSS
jgi:hypothetical protein